MDGRGWGVEEGNVRACPFASISPPIILKVRWNWKVSLPLPSTRRSDKLDSLISRSQKWFVRHAALNIAPDITDESCQEYLNTPLKPLHGFTVNWISSCMSARHKFRSLSRHSSIFLVQYFMIYSHFSTEAINFLKRSANQVWCQGRHAFEIELSAFNFF